MRTSMETVLLGMSNPLFRGTYAYDANGCRISKTEQIRMDATTPLKVMETCYTYESMERLTEENYHTADGASTKQLHYVYDVYNRNVSVTGDGFAQKNHYDAEGYRDSIIQFRMLGLKNGQKKWNKL